MIFKKEVTVILIVIFIIDLSPNVYSAVFINEILANGIIEPDSEWVELFNNESFDVNLTNFNISETASNNLTLNITIPANSFIVLVENFTLFNSSFPNVNQSGIKIIEYGEIVPNFELSNTKGTVTLYNSSGSKIDTVEYAQSSTTQEDISIGRYPDGSLNTFNISTLTPGAKNDNQAPKFNKWLNPQQNNTYISGLVNVTANITDDTIQVNSAIINFNGTNYSMDKQGDIWSFLWNTRLNIQKPYNITIFFNDSYGKYGFDKLFNITLNNTNFAPFVTSVNLTNTDFLNRTNGTLQAFWSFADLDNDTIIANETLWYVNGIENSSFRNFTIINSNYTIKNQNWTFSVRVFDGFDWSNFTNSSKITILNAKPSINISNFSITVLETQLVNISFSVSDLDNDSLAITSNKSGLIISNNSLLWQTNLTNSGTYTINIAVNDTSEIDSTIINITITDARDIDNDNNPDFNDSDDDNDGISDENDFLIGNTSNINTTISINITINGTSNLSKLFNGILTIGITNGTEPIIEFNFTFNSSNILDFGNITINRTTNGSSAVAIRGNLNLFNSKKTFFLKKINITVKAVCIKDADIGFDAISSTCDAANETLLTCDNITHGKYACFDTGTRYNVNGLCHSAVKELCRDIDGDGYGTGCSAGNDCNDNDASKTTDCSTQSSDSSASAGGSGSGGGGGVICISNWQCEEWSQCINGFKNRKCFDISQCAFPTKKPEESQACVINETKENLANIAQQPGYINKTKQDIAAEGLSGITGKAVDVKSGKEGNLGALIILVEVFVIVGAYLIIKKIYK